MRVRGGYCIRRCPNYLSGDKDLELFAWNGSSMDGGILYDVLFQVTITSILILY